MTEKLITSFKKTIISTAAMAELFAVSDRTIRNWCEDGLPRIENGKFSLVEVLAWWRENQSKAASEKEEKARERYWQAKAEREEIAVKKLKESVIEKADLEKIWVERVIEIVRGLESQENIFPALFAGKTSQEIREIIHDYNRKLRLNYARDGKYTPIPEYKAPPKSKAKKPAKKKPAKKKKK